MLSDSYLFIFLSFNLATIKHEKNILTYYQKFFLILMNIMSMKMNAVSYYRWLLFIQRSPQMKEINFNNGSKFLMIIVDTMIQKSMIFHHPKM